MLFDEDAKQGPQPNEWLIIKNCCGHIPLLVADAGSVACSSITSLTELILWWGELSRARKLWMLNFIGKNAREPSAFIIVQFVWKWKRCAKDV